MQNFFFRVFMLLFSILILSSCAQIYRPMLEPHYMKKYGDVKIGMLKGQVVEQWGDPYKMKEVNGKEYDEIWIYVPHWKFKNYLYFKNGVLVGGDPNPEDLI